MGIESEEVQTGSGFTEYLTLAILFEVRKSAFG
jgi:hypothetical protein